MIPYGHSGRWYNECRRWRLWLLVSSLAILGVLLQLQSWQEVRASDTPGSANSLIPQIQVPQTVTVEIWVDRGNVSRYTIGEPITLCYSVSQPIYIEIWRVTSLGTNLFSAGFDDGTGDCYYGVVGPPVGVHAYRIAAFDCYHNLLAMSGTWIFVLEGDLSEPTATAEYTSQVPSPTPTSTVSFMPTPTPAPTSVHLVEVYTANTENQPQTRFTIRDSIRFMATVNNAGKREAEVTLFFNVFSTTGKRIETLSYLPAGWSTQIPVGTYRYYVSGQVTESIPAGRYEFVARIDAAGQREEMSATFEILWPTATPTPTTRVTATSTPRSLLPPVYPPLPEQEPRFTPTPEPITLTVINIGPVPLIISCNGGGPVITLAPGGQWVGKVQPGIMMCSSQYTFPPPIINNVREHSYNLLPGQDMKITSFPEP